MPYLYCEKRKHKMKVDIEVCFKLLCPNVKLQRSFKEEDKWICDFKSEDQKSIEKRKKK